MKQIFLTPLFILILLLTACDLGPNSGRGFSLPEGNIDKGRATFVELECNACHSVGDIEYIGCDDGPDINIELQIGYTGSETKSQPESFPWCIRTQ